MALVIFVGYLLQFGLFANSPLIDTVPNILPVSYTHLTLPTTKVV